MKFLFALVVTLTFYSGWAQNQQGSVSGNVLDSLKKPLSGASILIRGAIDSSKHTVITGDDGSFLFPAIPFGYHKMTISFVGFADLIIDSIHLHQERYTINLNELTLAAASSSSMDAVIIYAEKPLIQSKDGNITFNAAESPLAAGSNASDLLTTVPLISKDPSGKLLVRGKEPKILIDDKPVELNLQQLQDLLESLPGSAIEKIEVLTNPPAQYANESSVINIVTKKGRVGRSGRVSVYGGTMGEKGTNLSYNYRKQGLSFSIYAGATRAVYKGSGYSVRENKYADSINHFRSDNNYRNEAFRPNLRTNIDYDINKNHAINFVFQYNQGSNLNRGITEYRNFNRFDTLYRFSTRDIVAVNDNYNPNLSLNYTFRSKKAGEVLRIFSNVNFGSSESSRDLLLNYYNPDLSQSHDSLQMQNNSNKTHGYSLRVAYDVPLLEQKTFLSLGSFHTASNSRVIVDAAFKKGANEIIAIEPLSNDFYFHQNITNGRLSVKQIIAKGFSLSSGLSAEFTNVQFELFKNDSASTNSYQNLLPFFTLNKNWDDKLNFTASYRKTIRRPGINEQNPSIDYSDPYNVRFGNARLQPASTHNFDLILGKTAKDFYVNIGLGYNTLKDIFSQVRVPVNDSKTETSWQNISDKQEYEISSWSGYTLWKKWRINLSASYTYNEYIRTKQNFNNRFINAGSLTSNFNTNYTWKDLYTVTGHVTYNRFANPQGTVRANVSMNLGAQAKLLQKKLVLSLNLVDPFNQQENRTFTYGNTFSQENYNLTKTRNFRLTVAYHFIAAAPRKNISKDDLKRMMN